MKYYRVIDAQEPSRQAIQEHIAPGRCEVTTVGYAKSQVTSGLQSVVSARTAPIPDDQDFEDLTFAATVRETVLPITETSSLSLLALGQCIESFVRVEFLEFNFVSELLPFALTGNRLTCISRLTPKSDARSKTRNRARSPFPSMLSCNLLKEHFAGRHMAQKVMYEVKLFFLSAL